MKDNHNTTDTHEGTDLALESSLDNLAGAGQSTPPGSTSEDHDLSSSQPEETSAFPWIKVIQISGIILSVIGTLALLVNEMSEQGNIERFFTLCVITLIGGVLARLLASKKIDSFGSALLAAISLLLVPLFWGQFGAIIFAYIFEIASATSSNLSTLSTPFGYQSSPFLPSYLRFSDIELSTLIGATSCLLIIIPTTVSGMAILSPHRLLVNTVHITIIGLVSCLPFRSETPALVALMMTTLGSQLLIRLSTPPQGKAGDWAQAYAEAIPLVTTAIMVMRYVAYNGIEGVAFPAMLLIATFLRVEYRRCSSSFVLNVSELLIALSLIAPPFKLLSSLPLGIATAWKMVTPSAYLLLTSKVEQQGLRYLAYNLLGSLTLCYLNFNGNLLLIALEVIIGGFLIAKGRALGDGWLKLLGLLIIICALSTQIADIITLLKDLGWAALVLGGIIITFVASIAPKFVKETKGGKPNEQ